MANRKVILGEGFLEIQRGTAGAGDSIILWDSKSGPQTPIKKTRWDGFKVRLTIEVIE